MMRLSRCLLNEVGFFAIQKIVLDQERTVIGRGEKNIHFLIWNKGNFIIYLKSNIIGVLFNIEWTDRVLMDVKREMQST